MATLGKTYLRNPLICGGLLSFGQHRIEVADESFVVFAGADAYPDPVRKIVLVHGPNNHPAPKEPLKQVLTIADSDQDEVGRARHEFQAARCELVLQELATYIGYLPGFRLVLIVLQP